MSTESELRSERSSKESQKSSHEQEKSKIEAKITKLEAAKKSIATIKDNLKTLKQGVKNNESPDSIWKGETYNKYHNYVSGTFAQDYTNYINRTDYVLDSLCDEIIRLRNEASDLTNIIGWLASKIRDLGNEIEKFFN